MKVELYCRFEEIAKKSKVEYHAGGSTQNSVKIAQVSLYLRLIKKAINQTSQRINIEICQ